MFSDKPSKMPLVSASLVEIRWRKYPYLHLVAAKLFSVRVSSASAEHLFSMAGLIRTARRNRMGALLFDAMIAYAYYNNTRLREYRKAKELKREAATAAKK